MIFFLLTGFTIWMAVETVRRGQMMPWLWVVLFFGPVGAAVYFFVEYIGKTQLWVRRAGGKAVDLRRAEAEVRRLDNAAAWGAYASALRQKKRFTEAKEAARTAVEKEPDDPHLLYELGLCELATGQSAAAIGPLSKVVERDPGFDLGEAMAALARAQRASGDRVAARATLDELAIRSSRPAFLYALASLQAEMDDVHGAQESLERIIGEAEYVPAYLKGEVRPWVRRARRALKEIRS